MKEYYNTQVYNALRIFFKNMDIQTGKMPRDKRYSLVSPLLIDIEKMMFYVGKACGNSETFVEYIEKCIDIIDNMKIHIRNFKDLNLISNNGFSVLSMNEEEIVRQLVGWKNSKIKKHE